MRPDSSGRPTCPVIRWSATEGLSYTILRTGGLVSGDFEVLATGVPGVAPEVEFVDPAPLPARGLYRVLTE